MPKVQPVINEIATVEKDIYQDYIGRTLINPDKVLKSESGGKGVELYEDLLRDDKVGSTLQTRKLAVIGREWEVVPAGEKRQDQKVADYVKSVLGAFDFDAARMMLLSGLVMGFKPGEVMWEYSEGDVWVREIIGRASRRFVFDLDRRLRLLTLTNMTEGEELPERKFVVFTNTSDNGSPYGDGLGRLLYWPVWFKKNAVKFWMVFADKFGSPTAVGKYPPGTPKTEQNALLDAIDAIQQEAAVIIPDTMVVDLLEATRAGSVNTYETLCAFMNNAIAQVMLGQTLTSDIGDKGSYAAAKTHDEVRLDYVKADADAICQCLNNSLIKWIVDYNFPGYAGTGPGYSGTRPCALRYPKVWIRCEEEKDLKPLAERDVILVRDIGLPVTKQYFYDTYGIPEPLEGEETVSGARRTDTGIGQIGLMGPMDDGKKEKKGSFSESPIGDLIAAQQQIDALAGDAVAKGGIGLSVLERIVSEAESYEDLQDLIAEAYSGINLAQFREILARAMFMADLKGRTLA